MRNFRKMIDENDLKDSYDELNHLNSEYMDINRFNSEKKSISACQNLIDKYYGNDDSSISKLIMKIILKREYFRAFSFNNDKSDSVLKFFIDSDKNLDAFDYFFENDFINPIFYIDNVSILDFEEHNSKFMPLHKSELIDKLYSNEIRFPIKRELPDEKLKNILDKIEGIINGEYFFEGHIFTTNIPSSGSEFITFSTSEDEEPKIGLMGDNISSGTKQIGIIQILLLNNILKKDSYLILDEPEVNLHPRWQFKFAEILVLLAKELNISLYINSHSPMFIESIDAFCEYYDMEDDINYYLTEKSEEKYKYNFTKINSNELYKIYDNLGSTYKLINKLKLRKKFNK